jgi:hypothetical protein
MAHDSRLVGHEEAIDKLRCQYPQKSTLGLFRITSATTRSTWTPFASRR